MKIRMIRFLSLLAFLAGCSHDSTDFAPRVPLGDEARGVTLSGPLAGKRIYLLRDDINIPNCWKDSVHWTGSELYYAVSSTNFTKLLAGIANEAHPGCVLPAGQSDPYFDIYRAVVRTGGWEITRLGMNSNSVDAAMSLSGGTMAFTVFQSSDLWDVYFINETAANSWGAPVPFQRNSTCIEDNAELYAEGTRVIFESKRTDSTGSSCDSAETRQLWYSEKDTGGNWSLPELMTGAPNDGDKTSQPWVDEENGYLYWTADSLCGCIRRVPFDGKIAIGAAETVITPSIWELISGQDVDGKIVFVGEYSHANGYAFIACGLAKGDVGGSDPNLYLGKWDITINLCVIPLD